MSFLIILRPGWQSADMDVLVNSGNVYFVDAVDMRQKSVACASLNLFVYVRLVFKIYCEHRKQRMQFHRTKFDHSRSGLLGS